MTRKRVDIDTLEVDELMRRGVAAARVGEADEARSYLTEVTVREPDNADAWLWLAGVETNPQVKRDHFKRVLAIRPGDADAQDGLARLAEKYGQGLLEPDDDVTALRCAWHPERETGLRCTRCSRPMCPECARQHPVGWRCKECAKELRSPLYKVSQKQYVLAFLTGLLTSSAIGVGIYLIGGIWIIALFISAGAGTAVAEAVSIGGQRKRGRGMQIVAAVCVVLGALVALWLAGNTGLGGIIRYSGGFGLVLYAIIGAATAYRRLR